MNSILILGSNGFSGYYFQKYIDEAKIYKDYHIYCVDLQNSEYYPYIEYIDMDVANKDALYFLLNNNKPNIIINLIGSFHSNDFKELYQINCAISQKLLELCVELSVNPDKILLIGSAAEYGIPDTLPITEDHPLKPVNFYGLTKVMQTQIGQYYYRQYHLNLNFARTFNILGQRISEKLAFGSFVAKIKKSPKQGTIQVGNLSSKRDFLDIRDVISAYWKIIQKGKAGEIYNVCYGNSQEIGRLLNILIETSGKSITTQINPRYLKKSDVSDIYGDNSKLKRHTNWEPQIPIIKSLQTMLN